MDAGRHRSCSSRSSRRAYVDRAARSQKRSEAVSDPALLSLSEVASADPRPQSCRRSRRRRRCCSRIEQWQPKLNAFVRIEADEALQAAKAADAQLAKSGPKGPLHGVPMAHKDMYYIAGKPAGCGSKVREGLIAPETSTAIKRLQNAGAIRIGALHMAEFAYGPTGHNAYLGPARNPWDIERITGGSSSGSARGGRGAADLCGARLRHRRLDPHAGAFLRHHRAQSITTAASAAPMPCRCPSRSTPSARWRAAPRIAR